jgi:ABC-type branched-subunit amino acid transport system ATPase component
MAENTMNNPSAIIETQQVSMIFGGLVALDSVDVPLMYLRLW